MRHSCELCVTFAPLLALLEVSAVPRSSIWQGENYTIRTNELSAPDRSVDWHRARIALAAVLELPPFPALTRAWRRGACLPALD